MSALAGICQGAKLPQGTGYRESRSEPDRFLGKWGWTDQGSGLLPACPTPHDIGNGVRGSKFGRGIEKRAKANVTSCRRYLK